MKILKGDFLSGFSKLMILGANIIILIYLYNKPISYLLYFSLFLFGNVLMFLSIIPHNNYFEYNNEKLIIKNTINPYINNEYKFIDIKKIEITRVTNVGIGIRIRFYNGKKKLFITDLPIYKLEEMISDIHELKKQFRDDSIT